MNYSALSSRAPHIREREQEQHMRGTRARAAHSCRSSNSSTSSSLRSSFLCTHLKSFVLVKTFILNSGLKKILYQTLFASSPAFSFSYFTLASNIDSGVTVSLNPKINPAGKTNIPMKQATFAAILLLPWKARRVIMGEQEIPAMKIARSRPKAPAL